MRIEDNWDDVLIYSIVFTSKKDLNKEVKKIHRYCIFPVDWTKIQIEKRFRDTIQQDINIIGIHEQNFAWLPKNQIFS